MDTQIVKVGENSMHVFVNSWDINQWAVFMAINQFSTKLGRNNHFKCELDFFVLFSLLFQSNLKYSVQEVWSTVSERVRVWASSNWPTVRLCYPSRVSLLHTKHQFSFLQDSTSQLVQNGALKSALLWTIWPVFPSQFWAPILLSFSRHRFYFAL